ncbi:Lysosomal Pro-X carboxypeptidase [Folsomia candida]|uniref:Lysosomal Pro-X carboxypeptidase n=1 Tax=Folsomia candida TaxID=158441 RepID=A0A226E5A5_FOLCA|nr:Lysosomal Pro-X carboxypeptidase [Folsomia candida]
MEKFYLLVALLALGGSCLGDEVNENDTDSGVYSYTTNFFTVPLDHFSFARRETFKIRYLVNDTYWDKKNNGPIFLYTGNEGSVEAFAENTGFMWDIAEEFGAALVFAEHRFYGQSSPPDTLKYKLENSKIRIMGYLTVTQTLADFAKLITAFKEENGAENSPVIAFGGSYGGVLTAWLRMKYPHVVAGGIASSAPFYLGNVPCETYDASLASIFGQNGNGNCVNVIRKSWSYLNHLGKTSKGRKWLTKAWRMCDPIEKDLPANPVKAFCSELQDTDPTNEKQVMRDMFQAINIYMNNSGYATCFDYSDDSMYSTSYSSNDDTAFNYQSCTELIDPECDDGVHDFFEPQTWDFAEFAQQCYDTYHVKPDASRVNLFFGGKDIIAASNIVFSNGLLDPWYAYGVLGNLSDSLIAVIIREGAHHLDLRAANEADPPSVVTARNLEKTMIKQWISQYHENQVKIQNVFAQF